jgi:hypothetical protein
VWCWRRRRFAESTLLPDVHTALPGETYSLFLGGSLKSKQTLRNTGGGLLEGSEVSVLLSVIELSALGGANIVFSGIEEVKDKHKCAREGALGSKR